jgi:ABC-type Fe3+/spermidine/putrescine transport system ATPase subunit
MVVEAKFGLELRGVCKAFGTVVAADEINLQVSPGELVSLLGPSGCGKTTVLRMIGGFLQPDKGDIYIGSELVTDLPANKRECGFVFQNYAIFPHMTVFDNIAYGLKLRKLSSGEIAETAGRTMEMLNLAGLERRYPKQLSGGQQQRVAIARALAISPRLFLLDEPLSNLDAKLRERVRFELRALQKKTGITTIFVTHDQSEAMVLSDRIAVMNHGRTEQVGSAAEIYYQPRTRFVADFIGQNNFIEGRVTSCDPDGNGMAIDVAGQTLVARFSEDAKEGQAVVACVRPEFIQVSQESPHPPTAKTWNVFEGKLVLSAFLGSEWRYEILTEAGFALKVCLQANRGEQLSIGDRLFVAWEKKDTYAVLS